jgi:hypothetical protein
MTDPRRPRWLSRVLARSEPNLWLVAMPGVCWWSAALALYVGAAAAGFPPAALGLFVPALFILLAFAAYAFAMGFAVFWSDAPPRWRALALVADWSPALAMAVLLGS